MVRTHTDRKGFSKPHAHHAEGAQADLEQALDSLCDDFPLGQCKHAQNNDRALPLLLWDLLLGACE